MFSLKKGRRIAFVKGGIYHGKTVRLNEENTKKCCDKCGEYSTSSKYCCKDSKKGKCGLCSKQSKKMKNIHKKGQKLYNKGAEPSMIEFIVQQEISKALKDDKKDMKFKDGKLIPLVNPKMRESLYISAPAGAGKSVYASKYAKIYKHMFPENSIILFSAKNKDPAFDKLKYKGEHFITRVKLDETYLEDPLQAKDLVSTLCIFDDVDFITDKDLKKEIIQLREKLLGEGRADETYVIITTHIMNNGNQTKLPLAEASSITFFPQGGDKYHCEETLKRYCGFKKKMIDHIMKLPSRWVTVYKRYPNYILHEGGCFMANIEQEL